MGQRKLQSYRVALGDTKKTPGWIEEGPVGQISRGVRPLDPLTDVLFVLSLRASAALHTQHRHAAAGGGPSTSFINRVPSCGTSKLCLPTISASFPAVGKKEAKQAEVFLWLAKRGVDMEEKELFVWLNQKDWRKHSSHGKRMIT